MQEIASAVYKSTGVRNPLVGIGAEGRHNGNALRDLSRMVRAASRMGLEITWLDLPVRQRRSRQIKVVKYPAIAPHELFSALHRVGHPMFNEPAAKVWEFWDNVEAEEWYNVHPASGKPRKELGMTLPVMLHGDEGVGHKKRGLFVFQWGPVLCDATHVLDTRLLVTVVPSRQFARQGKRNLTLERLYAFVAWSLGVMFDGSWPFRGQVVRQERAGTPLALGFCAAFVGLKGDWKFTKECTRTKRHYGAKWVCDMCFASGTIKDLAYNDPRPTAGWRLTIETHADWLRNTPVQDRSELCRVPGWHQQLIWRDGLHFLFLGIIPDWCASTLMLLAEDRAQAGCETCTVGNARMPTCSMLCDAWRACSAVLLQLSPHIAMCAHVFSHEHVNHSGAMVCRRAASSWAGRVARDSACEFPGLASQQQPAKLQPGPLERPVPQGGCRVPAVAWKGHGCETPAVLAGGANGNVVSGCWS